LKIIIIEYIIHDILFLNKNNKNKYEYLKCFNEKGVPNGLQFGFDFTSKIKDNPKVKLCVFQSCFVHLDAVLYLLNNEFQFVGNFIACDRCSQGEKTMHRKRKNMEKWGYK
jgi:hypothetical protein